MTPVIRLAVWGAWRGRNVRTEVALLTGGQFIKLETIYS